MVTRYDVTSSRWSSHFWVKMHVFSTSFNNKNKALGWNDAKCLFIAVLTWFLILGKVQDGDHCWRRHRPPAAPPPINCASSCWEDQRLSSDGKIVSKYCNLPKNSGGGVLQTPPPPLTTVGVGICVYVRGLRPQVSLFISNPFGGALFAGKGLIYLEKTMVSVVEYKKVGRSAAEDQNQIRNSNW